jgi:hypothetical protein
MKSILQSTSPPTPSFRPQPDYSDSRLDNQNREKMRHLRCLCFIRPSPESIQSLIEELREPKYGEYNICEECQTAMMHAELTGSRLQQHHQKAIFGEACGGRRPRSSARGARVFRRLPGDQSRPHVVKLGVSYPSPLEYELRCLEPGLSTEVHRRCHGTAAGSEEETFDTIPEEQPHGKEACDRGSLSHDARGPAFRFSQNGYTAYTFDC